MKKFLYKDLTYKIIGCAIEVHKILGPGFLESVYERAVQIEFKISKIIYKTQVHFPVLYKGENIKSFLCDLVVDEKIIVELKAIKEITNIDRAQLINYLKVIGLKVGLLINFGAESLEYERIVL